jgi:hypothetical protein
MLTPAELVALPKGQAFALLEGGQLWKLRMPLPDASKDPVMPESLAAVTNEMERTYITNDQWYRQRETWWHAVSDLGPPGGASSTSSDQPAEGNG